MNESLTQIAIPAPLTIRERWLELRNLLRRYPVEFKRRYSTACIFRRSQGLRFHQNVQNDILCP